MLGLMRSTSEAASLGGRRRAGSGGHSSRPENAILMQSGEPHNRRPTSRDGAARERLTGKILASDLVCFLGIAEMRDNRSAYHVCMTITRAAVSCRVHLIPVCPRNSNCLFFRFAVSLSSPSLQLAAFCQPRIPVLWLNVVGSARFCATPRPLRTASRNCPPASIWWIGSKSGLNMSGTATACFPMGRVGFSRGPIITAGWHGLTARGLLSSRTPRRGAGGSSWSVGGARAKKGSPVVPCRSIRM